MASSKQPAAAHELLGRICCDEAMDAVEDIGASIVATFNLPAAEKKARREALVGGPIPFFLARLQRRWRSRAGAISLTIG